MTLVKLPNGEEGTLADFIQMIRLDISLFFDAGAKSHQDTGYIWEHKKKIGPASIFRTRDLLQILRDRRGRERPTSVFGTCDGGS